MSGAVLTDVHAPRAHRGERRTQIVRAVARLMERATAEGTAAQGVRPADVARLTELPRNLAGTLLSIYAKRGFVHSAGPKQDMSYFLERDHADAYARRIGSERVVVKAPLRQVLRADAPVVPTANGVRHTVAPVGHDYRYHVPASFEGGFMADWHARRAGLLPADEAGPHRPAAE